MNNIKEKLPKGVKLSKGEKLESYFPNCYCVLKFYKRGGIFAVPPPYKNTIAHSGYINITFDKSMEKVNIGDWCGIAHVSSNNTQNNRIIINHTKEETKKKQSIKKQKTKNKQPKTKQNEN